LDQKYFLQFWVLLAKEFQFRDVMRMVILKWTPLSRPKNGDPSLLSHQRPVMLAPR